MTRHDTSNTEVLQFDMSTLSDMTDLLVARHNQLVEPMLAPGNTIRTTGKLAVVSTVIVGTLNFSVSSNEGAAIASSAEAADTDQQDQNNDNNSESASGVAIGSEAWTRMQVAEQQREQDRLAKIEALEPNVIGDDPCGPEVDDAEVRRRLENGEVVVKPSEVADHFAAHPEVEQGHNTFWSSVKGFDKLYNFLKNRKAVVNPQVLNGNEDSMIRQLKARQTAGILEKDVVVQNHQCNPETGDIYKVNNITALTAGEQVWKVDLTQADLDAMEADGVEIPQELITVNNEDINIGGGDDEAVVLSIIMERLCCNNPLLARALMKAIKQPVRNVAVPEKPTVVVTPSPSPSPSPSETTTPSPSPTPTPTRTRTPSPSPSPTTSPTPTETPSGGKDHRESPVSGNRNHPDERIRPVIDAPATVIRDEEDDDPVQPPPPTGMPTDPPQVGNGEADSPGIGTEPPATERPQEGNDSDGDGIPD